VGEGFVPSTVEVAPSEPNRIYVTGAIENQPSIVLRSDDRGHNWQRFAFDSYGSLPLFISAVDPVDPNLLYARVDNQADPLRTTTQRQPADHLLVSRDGGETWQTVFSLDGELFGFALSPDGSRIATGGPELGVYLASTRDLDFQPAPAPVRGLRWLKIVARMSQDRDELLLHQTMRRNGVNERFEQAVLRTFPTLPREEILLRWRIASSRS